MYLILFIFSEINGQGLDLSYESDWTTSTFPAIPLGVEYDKSDRPYFYVAAKEGGLLVYLDGDQPSLIKTLDIGELRNLEVMNLHQEDDRLYLSLGNFFDEGAQEAGLAIIDVAEPSQPSVLGIWSDDEKIKGSTVVDVEWPYAYLGAMTAGVILFDVTNPDQLQPLSRFIPDIDFPRQDPSPSALPNARGLAIRNDTLFLAYDSGGMRIIDYTIKTAPEEIGRVLNSAIASNKHTITFYWLRIWHTLALIIAVWKFMTFQTQIKWTWLVGSIHGTVKLQTIFGLIVPGTLIN